MNALMCVLFDRRQAQRPMFCVVTCYARNNFFCLVVNRTFNGVPQLGDILYVVGGTCFMHKMNSINGNMVHLCVHNAVLCIVLCSVVSDA